MKQRRKNLQSKLQENNLDALLVTEPANLFYLFNFNEEGCVSVSTKNTSIFFAPVLNFPEVREYVPGAKILQMKQLGHYLEGKGIKRLGFETALSYESVRFWQKAFTGVKFVPAPKLLEEMRLVKEESELMLLQRAAAIADDVMKKVVSFLTVGKQEQEVAARIDTLIRQSEAELAFKTIVASGPSSACPHHLVSSRRLAKNEMVILDLGARYGGYHSDLTRTIFLGKITRKFNDFYKLVLEAQEKAIAIIRPGVESAVVDEAARQVFRKKSVEKFFVHSTGHGVGLQVHEAPRLAAKSQEILQEGMVVTVEPGIYIPGWGGIRIEDMVEVTATGARVLTQAIK